MNGFNPIGQFGMPDHQYKQAIHATSGVAAQGTGVAKKQASELEEHNDEVSLSQRAQVDVADDAAQTSGKADEKDKELKRDQDDTEKLKQQRMSSVSGHAAMASGVKDKDKEKEAKKKPAVEEEGDVLSQDEFIDTKLDQASGSGIFDGEVKSAKRKRIEEDPVMKDGGLGLKGSFHGGQDSDLYRKTTPEVRPELIEEVMNRNPEDILKDVPKQFRGTAQMMVTGQISPAGKPKETLTQMKPGPVECTALELMPETDHPVMDISFEAPPIPVPVETPQTV